MDLHGDHGSPGEGQLTQACDIMKTTTIRNCTTKLKVQKGSLYGGQAWYQDSEN